MALKRPNAVSFSKKNAVRPFEDASSLEFWAQKNDGSLFVVGQSTKKRPDGLTLVRMFDHRVLDMCEVGVEGWKSMQEFKVRITMSEHIILLCSLATDLDTEVDTGAQATASLCFRFIRHPFSIPAVEVSPHGLLQRRSHRLDMSQGT